MILLSQQPKGNAYKNHRTELAYSLLSWLLHPRRCTVLDTVPVIWKDDAGNRGLVLNARSRMTNIGTWKSQPRYKKWIIDGITHRKTWNHPSWTSQKQVMMGWSSLPSIERWFCRQSAYMKTVLRYHVLDCNVIAVLVELSAREPFHIVFPLWKTCQNNQRSGYTAEHTTHCVDTW